MSLNFTEDKMWAFMKAEIEKQIENYKTKIVDTSTTWEQVLEHRGRIAALKQVLALPQTIALVATKRG